MSNKHAKISSLISIQEMQIKLQCATKFANPKSQIILSIIKDRETVQGWTKVIIGYLCLIPDLKENTYALVGI